MKTMLGLEGGWDWASVVTAGTTNPTRSDKKTATDRVRMTLAPFDVTAKSYPEMDLPARRRAQRLTPFTPLHHFPWGVAGAGDCSHHVRITLREGRVCHRWWFPGAGRWIRRRRLRRSRCGRRC